MQITHDIIAAVTGPDWKYGLSRILINDEGRGAVFIAGSEAPLTEFTVGTLSTSRGTGLTDAGGEVVWRRRGSSCQYKLAKCKVNTVTLMQMWRDNREVENSEVVAEGAKAGAAEVLEPDASKGDIVTETVADETPVEVVEAEPVEVEEKPKRKRRTKAQIEADKLEAERLAAEKAKEELL